MSAIPMIIDVLAENVSDENLGRDIRCKTRP